MNFAKSLEKTSLTLVALSALASGCAMPVDGTEPEDAIEAIGSSEQALGGAAWKGDVEVTISAVKNVALHRITYTIKATNLGDDDARNVIISHAPSFFDGVTAMSFVAVKASSTTCTGGLVSNYIPSVTCNPVTLAVGATETVTVIVNNPGDVSRRGTAQAMGITPDPVPSNNYASVDVL